jgi:hypothetical protein
MIRFVLLPNTNNYGPAYKIRITPLQAESTQIENAITTRPDNCRDPLPGDQRQKPLGYGV